MIKKAYLAIAGMVVLSLAGAPLLVAEEAGEIDGKKAFGVQKCAMCHGVAAENIKPKARSEKMLGPDLSGFKSEITPPELSSFMRGELAIEDVKHKKPFKGTDEELQAIVDWLGSLAAQE